jgi:hypothetical protein
LDESAQVNSRDRLPGKSLQIIGENTAVTISLVGSLLAVGWAFAFFLQRYVTRREFGDVIREFKDQFDKFEVKLDKVLYRHLDKH